MLYFSYIYPPTPNNEKRLVAEPDLTSDTVRIAGAAMLAPMVNPYDPHMTKEETKRTWEKWLPRRKMMYSLARRFPKLLTFFYRKSFLPEQHDEIDKLLSFSTGKKVSASEVIITLTM